MSAVSSLGNKVIYRYLGFTFQTSVKQNTSIILSSFHKGLGPFQLSKHPCHTPSFIHLIYWSQTLSHHLKPFPIYA